MDPIRLLIREHNYEIELHDMLVSDSSAEDLLAYRKADLIFSFSPLQNRSIACTTYTSIPFVFYCRKDHPRLGDTADREQLQQERFTAFLSDEPGVKSFQEIVTQALPERNIAFRSDSYMSLLAMVSVSDMIGLVPELVFTKYAELFNLKKINFDYDLPIMNIYMMYNRSALNSNTFSDFIHQISQ
jgi:DNA-binding transcriptional LysR family regulator